MFDSESLSLVGTIIDNSRPELLDRESAVALSETALERATAEANKARADYEAALAAHTAAQDNQSEAAMEVMHLQADSKRSLWNIANEIESQEEAIDPATRIVYGLSFAMTPHNEPLSIEYQQEQADLRKLALDALFERLQPGEPILIKTYNTPARYAAAIATAETLELREPLRRTPPTGPQHYSHGSAFLDLPNVRSFTTDSAFSAAPKHRIRIPLISQIDMDPEAIKKAANNTDWLVVGADAIWAKIESVSPVEQFAGLSAVASLGIPIPEAVQVASPEKEDFQEHLAEVLAIIAIDRERAIIDAVEQPNNPNVFHHGFEPLRDEAAQIYRDFEIVQFMANALDITKRDLRETVHALLVHNRPQIDIVDFYQYQIEDAHLDWLFGEIYKEPVSSAAKQN